ncbi:Crp/Fnr family transcriptional regulator [Bdellovibrio sp. NC01]|uniref:Crp/Fnr family transcriptional regulator n=1 Tax=Bdellovibrio sp. NC01 TaxID=2220073 RepID=UPI00115B73DA|nr:cyclic nucleotide-binding domain-containing protein [Bdellovibrio sp. NC01]QDK38503.1 cyclic nucleotide-binding domain-containing protein [Bdellovibrio sp. NC01]
MSDAIVKETYPAGDYIFFEGDLERHFYIIETGTVSICTMNRQGQKVELGQVHDGESFGEFALLENKPRSASAMAVTEVTLVRVSEEGFQELLEDLPVWANCMLKSFADRLKKTTAALKDAEDKLR